MNVQQQVAAGDKVSTHCTMTGTHQGPWMGIAPTGRQVHVEMMVTHRIADGKIAEDWVLIEAYGFFHRLGLLPPRSDLIAGATTGAT
jgi:predicted ester cyclase